MSRDAPGVAVEPAIEPVGPVADPVLAPLLGAVEPVVDPVDGEPVDEDPMVADPVDPVRASAPPIELDPMLAAPPEMLALTSMKPPAALLLPDVPVAPVVVGVEALVAAPAAPEPDTRHPVTTTF